MRAWLLFSLALWLLPTGAVADAPQGPEARELAARIEALGRVTGRDESVERPLVIARRALIDAQAARQRGAHEAAAIDDALALAALELAEARQRLVRERSLLSAAEARRREAERALARDASGAPPTASSSAP